MCSEWQTAGVSAIASITSAVKSRGCGEVKRTRSRPSIAPTARSSAAERVPVAELPPVRVDVLPEQRHLEHALLDQRRHLGQHVARPPVALLAAQRRHDAEGAGVVAADRDRHPGRVRRVAPGRQRRTGRSPATRGSRPAPRRRCRARSSSAGSEPMLWVPKTTSTHGARRMISPRSFCARQPPTAICMPGRAALHRAQVAEVAVQLVVRVLPDRAGVEHDHVRAEPAAARARSPASSSRPDSRSESCTFIWQP